MPGPAGSLLTVFTATALVLLTSQEVSGFMPGPARSLLTVTLMLLACQQVSDFMSVPTGSLLTFLTSNLVLLVC